MGGGRVGSLDMEDLAENGWGPAGVSSGARRSNRLMKIILVGGTGDGLHIIAGVGTGTSTGVSMIRGLTIGTSTTDSTITSWSYRTSVGTRSSTYTGSSITRSTGTSKPLSSGLSTGTSTNTGCSTISSTIVTSGLSSLEADFSNGSRSLIYLRLSLDISQALLLIASRRRLFSEFSASHRGRMFRHFAFHSSISCSLSWIFDSISVIFLAVSGGDTRADEPLRDCVGVMKGFGGVLLNCWRRCSTTGPVGTSETSIRFAGGIILDAA